MRLDWIVAVEDTIQWQGVVSTVMNLRVL